MSFKPIFRSFGLIWITSISFLPFTLAAESKVEPKQALKTMSLGVAQAYLNHFRNGHPFLCPKYLPDGCKEMAHLMSHMLKFTGFKTRKIWLTSNKKENFRPPLFENWPYRQLYLIDRRLRGIPGDILFWNYHVASIVYVETEAGIEERVLDVAFDRPVSISEWAKHYQLDPSATEILITPAELSTLTELEKYKADPESFVTSEFIESVRFQEAIKTLSEYQAIIKQWDHILKTEASAQCH